MVWSYSLFLAKQIITPYHAAQKAITKDQHALIMLHFFVAHDHRREMVKRYP